MSEVIRVLQLGTKDWREQYRMPDYVHFTFSDFIEESPKKPFDIIFVGRQLSTVEITLLHKETKAHTLFFIKGVRETRAMQHYFACRKGKYLEESDIQNFLLNEARNYFPKPYGEKFQMENLSIAQGFAGSVAWDGNYCVLLDGDYGTELSQIAFWRNNIPIFKGQAIDMWLEYEKDPEVEIGLKVVQFRRGSVSTIQKQWFFDQQQLEDIVTVDNQNETGPVFVSLMAKGKGKLKIVALHDRYSRRGHGIFLPGGNRVVTSKREEIFYYFDPGDMKPPLNVYFSGYKTLQGFEGYNMMRKMGCPFLLIGEPRLSGGAFYMGDQEYEKAMVDILQKHLEELGFTNDQIILSGMSMGTYGALYYGCDIKPHAMILGKPLASIGDVAQNERLNRPGGFPTSLDLLHYLEGSLEQEAVKSLNDRFWNKFDATDWGKSIFIVAYMIEDDYDNRAYNMLLSHINSDGVQLYGKGIHGRHNDSTNAIASWFKGQYEKVLLEDFSRRIKN